MSAVKALVFQRNPTRFDMAGQRLTTTLTETAQTISPGLVQRLRHYAAGVLEEAGFDVGSWACEVYTMDADESPADRSYTVEFVNPRGGMLGVQGILTEHGWPRINHGLCVGSDYPAIAKATGSASLVGLGKGDGVILTPASDVDQRVPVPAAGAQEENAVVVDHGRGRSEHDSETATPARPHSGSPSMVRHRTAGSAS